MTRLTHSNVHVGGAPKRDEKRSLRRLQISNNAILQTTKRSLLANNASGTIHRRKKSKIKTMRARQYATVSFICPSSENLYANMHTSHKRGKIA